MNGRPWTLAIDFGTSNTTASSRPDGGEPRPVRLSEDSDQMPSAVLVTGQGIRVGTEAVRAARLHPEGFEEAPKTRLGTDSVLLGGREIEVVDLVAAVLARAAGKAQQRAGGHPPREVLLTHPFDWGAPRRSALLDAWHRTGVPAERVHLVTEPVAAAAYFVGSAPAPGSRLAVVDVGGGTCDVAVLRVGGEPDRPLQVVGHGGQDDLGGRAVDHLLLGYVRGLLMRTGRGDLAARLWEPANLGALLTLREHVRYAKHALAEWEDAAVPVAVGSEEAVLELTGDELTHLVEPIVDRMTALVTRTVQDAGMAPQQLDALYLTGGSAHLRPVATAMSRVLGDRPAMVDDPKLVVALGAHRAADHLAAPSRPSVVLSPPDRAPGPASSDQATKPGGAEPVVAAAAGRSRLRWFAPAAVTVLVLTGWAAQGLGDDAGDGGAPAGEIPEPTRPTAAPDTTPTTPTPTEEATAPADADARLLALAPSGAGECLSEPTIRGVATATCETTYRPADGPPLLMASRFTLFEDAGSMEGYFEEMVGEQVRSVSGACPDEPGVMTYNFTAGTTPVGRVACYRNGEFPAVTWSHTEALVVGQVQGPSGSRLVRTWEWWQQESTRIQSP